MHDSSGSVSTENEDAAKKLKLGNNKDSNNSNDSHAAAQLTKDVQAEQSEVTGLDRNGSEKRIGPTEMGLQTQQSGSLNGGNDVAMAEEEEESVEHALGTTSGEGSHKIQSTPETENAGDEGGMELEEAGGGGSPSAFNSEGLNGEGPVSTADSLSRASTDANGNGQAKAPAAAPPPPVLKGTLSYNIELRRHLIRGMWNYENSNALPPQRFELLRNLEPHEDPTVLPKDGEFHGSFSLAYFHTTSKGRQKERSKVIPESGVRIKFTKIEEEIGGYKVDGTGTNQFGIFHINGTATPSPHDDDPSFNIVLRKRYEPSAPAAAAATDNLAGVKKSKKRKMGSISGDGTDDDPAADPDSGPLPPPSQSYEKNVVCLRGKLYKETEEILGVGEHVHRIHGMWSSGLDLILADPQNVRELCNRFEYEHKGSGSTTKFPISGRYSGWFDLSQEDGTRKRIIEKDVTLRFRKNDAGYHNVEGKGSNVFGKYSITGTLTLDNVITIFRHFQPRKIKTPKPVTSAPPPINAPGQARRPSITAAPEPQLKLDEVKVPEGADESLEPLKPPEHPTYSAVSRGILRLNEDGSHSCQGKWAVTREHFTNGQTSNFNFRLEAHFAAEAAKNPDGRQFPLDSAMYKGSFQLKKGGSRYQTVVDQQVVMKFRKNSVGSYNVYGKGINGIGGFNLTGTLIMSGKTGGNVELYRMYPPALLANQAAPKASTPSTGGVSAVGASSLPKPMKATDPMPSGDGMPVAPNLAPSSSTMLPGPPRAGIVRRESTRLVKLPSRLEDDDPKAQLSRIMDKCNHILRFMREKDIGSGAFFSEPVDPVALGIPTYSQVIKEPMDLRTIQKMLDNQEIASPEEFARLTRLVFENAMTFNVDPTHSVHQAARSLITLFNQKFRDVERLTQNLRRSQKGTDDEKKKKIKDDKKRKRGVDEPKSLKRRRLEEAQEMAAANSTSMAAILAAGASQSPDSAVTRNEFSMMLQLIQQLQRQVVQTFTALAEMSSDDVSSGLTSASQDSITPVVLPSTEVTPLEVQEKKKPPKKKAEALKSVEKPVVEDDSRPLTLKEQELLTDTINELPPDHLPGVIQIIREAAQLPGDEDEIDLEIDLLDTATQRKLLRHVAKVSVIFNGWALLLTHTERDSHPTFWLQQYSVYQATKATKSQGPEKVEASVRFSA